MKIIGKIFDELITVLKISGERVGALITMLGLAFALAFVILGWEVFYWLKEGIQPALVVRHLFSEIPTLTWIGVQEILDWILDLPMWVVVLVFGFGLTSLGTVMIFASETKLTTPYLLEEPGALTPRKTRFERWPAVMLETVGCSF